MPFRTIERMNEEDSHHMILCMECGNWNLGGSRFCERCGAVLAKYDRSPETQPSDQGTVLHVSHTRGGAYRSLADALAALHRDGRQSKDAEPTIMLDPGTYEAPDDYMRGPVTIRPAQGYGMQDVKLTSNSGDDSTGVTLSSDHDSPVTLLNLTITNNVGGGGFIDSCDIQGRVICLRSTLHIRNSALRQRQAYVRHGGSLVLDHCYVAEGVYALAPEEGESKNSLAVLHGSTIRGTDKYWAIKADTGAMVSLADAKITGGVFAERTPVMIVNSEITGDGNSYGNMPLILDGQTANPGLLTYFPNGSDAIPDSLTINGSKLTIKELRGDDTAENAAERKNSTEELLAKLDALTGLTSVKNEVRSQIRLIQFEQRRQAQGLPVTPITHNMIFGGNPGTGKTTVARIYGKLLYSLGVVSKDIFVEADRSKLVAGYTGQTALKTREVIEQARGGVLFIDEAYALKYKTFGNDAFGQEAIDTLLKAMEDYRDELVFILAGYTDEMTEFLDANAGIKSRVPTWLNFPDYSPEELTTITGNLAKRDGYQLAPDVAEPLTRHFAKALHEPHFGNARSARNLYEKAIVNKAVRESDPATASGDLTTLTLADFPI